MIGATFNPQAAILVVVLLGMFAYIGLLFFCLTETSGWRRMIGVAVWVAATVILVGYTVPQKTEPTPLCGENK